MEVINHNSDETMSDEKLYSLDQLEKMSSGDSAFINKMVEMFIQMVPEAVERMVNALANDDLEDLGSAAHKIKPSIDMMGITSLRQKIRDLEQWGKNRLNVDNIPDLLDEVIETLNKVIHQLRSR